MRALLMRVMSSGHREQFNWYIALVRSIPVAALESRKTRPRSDRFVLLV
jgi:hypothetical protein